MNRNDISLFCCLICREGLSLTDFDTKDSKEKNVKYGVLFCPSCKIFYPISDGVAFLLDSGYYPYFDIHSFLKKWKNQFDFNNYRLLDRKITPEKLKQVIFYNKDSDFFDSLVTYSKFWKASDGNVLKEWMNEIPMHGTILDVGCGTGNSSIPLFQSGRRIIATDISLGMIIKAMKKSVEAGLTDITYFLADAEDLPLKPSLFSAVVSFGLLHHLANPSIAIKKINELLVPEGCFYARENHASAVRFIFDILMKIHRLWNEEAGSYPIFKIKEIKAFINDSGMYPKIRTITFLPPHIFNLMSDECSRKILFFTDKFFSRIPLIKNFGGLLVIKAVKKKE